MRWIWLRCRPCQCMQPDKRLVLQLDWLQSDVLAAIDAEPIVCSALIRLNNEVVMATRPTPNSGVWERRHNNLEIVFSSESEGFLFTFTTLKSPHDFHLSRAFLYITWLTSCSGWEAQMLFILYKHRESIKLLSSYHLLNDQHLKCNGKWKSGGKGRVSR